MKFLERLRASTFAMWLRKPYRRIFRRLEDSGFEAQHPWRFMLKAKGVIHVGANTGQEAGTYALLKKRVIWIEPIPEAFEELTRSIRPFKRQIAFKALVSDKDDEIIKFNISNNNGLSSSLFDLGAHEELYPDVHYTRSLEIQSVSLDSFVLRNGVQIKDFDTLVMDVQGAELLVLKGASRVLQSINWIYAECADFEIYKGCCTRDELASFLSRLGFSEEAVHVKAGKPGFGNCYDILFKRIS